MRFSRSRRYGNRKKEFKKFDYGDDWKEIKNRRKHLDGGACTRCGVTKNLHVHHKIPLSKGGSNKLINLVTLCNRCHEMEHSRSHKHIGWHVNNYE